MGKGLALEACNPSSLVGYLKALGALRILAEQLNPDIRLYWDRLTPYLVFSEETSIDDVTDFFLNKYEPTPIVIPWSGSDFFDVTREGDPGPFKTPPSKGKIIEAFLASSSAKLEKYRYTLKRSLDIIEDLRLSKKDIEGSSSTSRGNKAQFMGLLRSWLPNEVVDFIDVAAVIDEDKIFTNTILGSGGGNDGNLHFGSNYMQCLWLCLPDFKEQHNLRGSYKGFDSPASLQESLFGVYSDKTTAIRGDSIGLYSSGYVGGPNAYEGFEAEALRNPWDLIFNIEGLILFKGALSSRSGSMPGRRGAASFPFTCRVSFDEMSTIVSKETGQREIWLPLWRSPASIKALSVVFSEGRAEVAGRQARDGVDFVRAIASLGVDRGIHSFQRYGIVKGRVGGDNYHTAINLGTVRTYDKPLENIDLFNDVDGWLSRLRNACSQERIANRYGVHLRSIESAISSYCRQGDRRRLQEVLLCLGRAEQAIASMGADKPVPPLRLSPRWVKACDDGSTEYRLACAVASIGDDRAGPLRVQMEPVEWEGDRKPVRWRKSDSSVCWGRGGLSDNLLAVLQRRVLEGTRIKTEFLPLWGKISVGLVDVYQFLRGYVDEKKINDLMWAISTIRWHRYRRMTHAPEWAWRPVPEMPRSYSLTKLLYLPKALVYSFDRSRWEYSSDSSTGTRIPHVPEVLNLLKAGRTRDVYRKVVQRLISSGLKPIGAGRGEVYYMDSLDSKRLAASLLIPVWEIDTLARSVLNPPSLQA
jgi:CRISPR-associated protein Csx17